MSKRVAAAQALVVRLGIAELELRLKRHRASIWRDYRAGRFPEPEYLDSRRVWRLDVIEAWERQRLARPPSERRCNLGAYAQMKADAS